MSLPAETLVVSADHATRAHTLFLRHRDDVYARTDRLFAVLLGVQWIAGVAAAIWISPRTWAGTESRIHMHVWAAVALGGLISVFPMVLGLLRPTRTSTRQVIAVAQALISALLIHLSGGRIETHFHVFGSLALLAFYRDWRVLVTFSAVVAADHVLRGIVWPQSIYGIAYASPWRSLEHAGWVVFEDVFLIRSCLQGVEEMGAIAERQARLESLNEGIECEVRDRTRELTASEERFRLLSMCAPTGVFETDRSGAVTYLNARWGEIAGRPPSEGLGDGWMSSFHPDDLAGARAAMEAAIRDEQPASHEARMVRPDGELRWVHAQLRPVRAEDGTLQGHVGTIEDITERRTLEMELRQSQKLEAVGRLAAGIAHEINTPIQFVGDNTRFLEDAFQSLRQLVGTYEQAVAAGAHPVDAAQLEILRAAAERADLPYLEEEVPKALAQSLDGIARVSAIVAAMKDFAHHDASDKAAADINRALCSTLTVARNELKYVADVETDLDEDLPPVVCNIGELNQVFLNLLVNGAHAIADVVSDTDRRGTIRVGTRLEGDGVTIAISDTGAGVPEAIRGQIFDPFFTTKVVGKGTGQGLALARAIVVEKHRGTITFESEVGKGTTFYVRIPLAPGQDAEEAA